MCNNEPIREKLIKLLAKCDDSIGFITYKMAKIITLLAGITLLVATSVQASLWDVKALGLKSCSLCITSLPINLESRLILWPGVEVSCAKKGKIHSLLRDGGECHSWSSSSFSSSSFFFLKINTSATMNSMMMIIIIGSAVLIQNMNWCFQPSQESLIRILEAGRCCCCCSV